MAGLKQGCTLKCGKYKIVKTLGQGSFGITYLATTRISMDGQLGKMDVNVNVTIKEFFMSDLNSRATDGTSVERTNSTLVKNYLNKFQREAANLSKLHHPNIVKVLEVFDENNTTYYVMEFIDGETIDEYIKRNGKLSVEESLAIIKEVCKALSYMHDHKMLHLDLKPKNIMRDSEGHIYLIDFGLAKQYNDNGEPESSTTLGLGTPGYAPIEQAHYKKDGTFPVTLDIYAVGASLYKMLTGKTPPESSYVLNDGLPHDALTKAGVYDDVIAVVEKAMAPIKKDRYQTVTDLSKAISMLLFNDEPPKTEDEEEGTTIDMDSGKRSKVEIDPDTDEIEFHFIGSSYPGSRSYETHITDKSVSLKISCYGDILLEEAFPFNKLRFSKLIEIIKNLDIHQIPKFDEGATGGETLSLILHRGGAEYYSGYIYGNEYNHLGGTTDANLYLVKSEVEKCIPNFQELLSKEREVFNKIGNKNVNTLKKKTLGFIKKCLATIILLFIVSVLLLSISNMPYGLTNRTGYWHLGDEYQELLVQNWNLGIYGVISGVLCLLTYVFWKKKILVYMASIGIFASILFITLYFKSEISAYQDVCETIDISEYKEVDLGLPSGTIWADRNLGAKTVKSDGYNYYYFGTGVKYNSTQLDSTVLKNRESFTGTEYDIAHIKLGGNWQMPSISQFEELVKSCTFYWQKGGYEVVGPNGNNIFLPCTHDDYGCCNLLTGNKGYYFYLNKGHSQIGAKAEYVDISEIWYSYERLYSIRPVKKQE